VGIVAVLASEVGEAHHFAQGGHMAGAAVVGEIGTGQEFQGKGNQGTARTGGWVGQQQGIAVGNGEGLAFHHPILLQVLPPQMTALGLTILGDLFRKATLVQGIGSFMDKLIQKRRKVWQAEGLPSLEELALGGIDGLGRWGRHQNGADELKTERLKRLKDGSLGCHLLSGSHQCLEG
jgi:hypothetical protein